MKVLVVPSYKSPKEFTVEMQQGHQSFRLDYTGQKSECRFMAKMLRVALVRHAAEASVTKPVTRKRKAKQTVIPMEPTA